jgi:hypothetical protein
MVEVAALARCEKTRLVTEAAVCRSRRRVVKDSFVVAGVSGEAFGCVPCPRRTSSVPSSSVATAEDTGEERAVEVGL